MKIIEAFVLIRNLGPNNQPLSYYNSIFLYPLWANNFSYNCSLTFDDIFSYPLACLRKENIDAINIEKGMIGFDS